MHHDDLFYFNSDDDVNARPSKELKNDPLSMFYQDLGSYGRIKPASDTKSDETVERERMANISLHRYIYLSLGGRGVMEGSNLQVTPRVMKL